MIASPFDISQLLAIRTAEGPRIVAQSAEVAFTLEEFARKLVVDFGEPGLDTFDAVFALPADHEHVAVVTTRVTGGIAAFRLLSVPVKLYRWIGDPFVIADRFPVNPAARGSLPMLTWPDEPTSPRLVADLQTVLKTGDAPLLLGTAQALVDGVRVRLHRPLPEQHLLRDLWRLLPTAQRGELWPAEFHTGRDLVFHIAVTPETPTIAPGIISEEQARDYPEGRYELALQTAVESGDQAALDRILARRTPREVFRTTLIILVFAVVVLLAMSWLR